MKEVSSLLSICNGAAMPVALSGAGCCEGSAITL